MDCVRLGENILKKDSICQVNVINQQNVTTATNYLEKEKVQKSLHILSKFTDNKQINIIFYLLAVEELCVCDIACLLNLSMASASHHLRKLANQNILDTRREGKIIYYFIKIIKKKNCITALGLSSILIAFKSSATVYFIFTHLFLYLHI